MYTLRTFYDWTVEWPFGTYGRRVITTWALHIYCNPVESLDSPITSTLKTIKINLQSKSLSLPGGLLLSLTNSGYALQLIIVASIGLTCIYSDIDLIQQCCHAIACSPILLYIPCPANFKYPWFLYRPCESKVRLPN